MTTLPQPPLFPSLGSLPNHFPSSTRQPTNTPTTITINPAITQVIPLVTSANPPNPPLYTLYVPNYVPAPQNPPASTNLVHTTPHDNVTFTNNHMQYIPSEHNYNHERYVLPVYTTYEPTFTAHVTVRVTCEIDQYVEMEREARTKKEKSVKKTTSTEETYEKPASCSRERKF